MSEKIKCSRCGRVKRDGEDWGGFSECPKCHARTERRYPKIRQYEPRDFKIETLFTFKTFEEVLAFEMRGKRISKVVKEKLRKEYDLRKADWERINKKRIAQLDCLFAIKRYPVHSQLCVKIRIEARKHYLEGEEWDVYSVTNHMGRCDDCNAFVVALKNGNLVFDQLPDPKEEEQLRQEGYCSLKEWNDRMNEFLSGAQSKPDLEERLFRGMRECCPNCGSELVKGLCLRCGIRPYEN